MRIFGECSNDLRKKQKTKTNKILILFAINTQRLLCEHEPGMKVRKRTQKEQKKEEKNYNASFEEDIILPTTRNSSYIISHTLIESLFKKLIGNTVYYTLKRVIYRRIKCE